MGLCFRGVLTGAALKVRGARMGGKKMRKSLQCVSAFRCECAFTRGGGWRARAPLLCVRAHELESVHVWHRWKDFSGITV